MKNEDGINDSSLEKSHSNNCTPANRGLTRGRLTLEHFFNSSKSFWRTQKPKIWTTIKNISEKTLYFYTLFRKEIVNVINSSIYLCIPTTIPSPETRTLFMLKGKVLVYCLKHGQLIENRLTQVKNFNLLSDHHPIPKYFCFQ